ncbi:sensor histidine kinase/response regulator, putative [Talaromyces stipitatus ATCC 10500]|uniref:histidine kinase n=1 Tax=Talaromyces stipitatus (strain ATCC 10500 / CBS 375.48 / QM 6759 / NRRL 1006) TaxID=441959 RepID=B8M7Y1_TALSN|nr:sensor histidine kinase/response regulator, putative [Talaromyces stipitatus ATCC 10500]EED19860.1 sensor histidine kinase/response regulator, putative [Talaromyces stipitatus ATCC 10500]
MEEDYILGDDLPLPPARLFERLALLPGYIWDQAIEPIHSTYDNWYVAGIRQTSDHDISTPTATSSGTPSTTRDSPRIDSRPPFRHHWRSSLSESSSELSSLRTEQEPTFLPVVARVSSHVVRLEREFHMLRTIVQVSDPDCNHTVRPVDIVRLPPEPGDPGPLLVSIYESPETPGTNSLKDLVAFGPAWFSFGTGTFSESSSNTTPGEQASLSVFLDFAIGACDCLEILHYGLKTIHGEIRPDAFHFNRCNGKVKLVNMGNGARSFDNALGEGWSALSREVGVKTKLQFIAPEQTGRMPTEPDSRTDIYALGVLFWIILVGKPAFTGSTPMDVVQNVLGRKLPPVSSKRMDIPDAVSAVIAKMTQKGLLDRYHTITAVKKDLEQIVKLLGNGDFNALKNFEVAKNDVSSFFTLPSQMFGREEEFQKIMNIAEKVHRRQQALYAKMVAQANLSAFGGSASSISESRIDSFDFGEGSSDSGSLNYVPSRHNSTAGPLALNHVPTRDSVHSTESSLSTQRGFGPMHRTKGSSSADHRSLGDSGDRDSTHLSANTGLSPMETLNPMSRHRAANKVRRSGHCEVITITGNPGIGKTDLIQRVQPAIRKLGYIGVARLDRARRIPFEPFAKILASLLRQIFSERDVTTEYHNNLRSFLRPLWPTLHQVLDLPEQLISNDQKDKPISPKMGVAQHILKENSKTEIPKRPSFLHGTVPADIFTSSSSNKTMRLMEMYLEILRHLCSQKLICVCLDDLQYADDESSDLIGNICKTRIPCLLILAARKQEIESRDMLTLFNAETPSITKIELHPLSEEDVARFVSATMQLEPDPRQTPLSVVVIEKSQGNPFFMRMMLETCYRKNCIWYSWKNSRWEFDIDRIFTEFVSPEYGDSLGTDFILKRFQEFPPSALAILVWAAFLGSPFSFSLIQRLMEGEFWYDDGDGIKCNLTPLSKAFAPRSEAEAVSGLQFLVQGYIVLPGDSDDEFRFAHDRFARAVGTLSECHNVEKMHFVIAQTMMKYCTREGEMYPKSHHICQSTDLIRKRVRNRHRYRKVLLNSARIALSLGARPTALMYSRHALKLLQPNCWDAKAPDVDYEETLQLHNSTAELLSYQEDNKEALTLLEQVFRHARSAADKSRGWIIKSKIATLAGDFNGAMDALLSSLEELGIQIRQPTTYEQCDIAFKELRDYLQPRDFETLILQPISQDPMVTALGLVLAEAMAVAFWGDDLTYMHLGVEMMRLHLFTGRFSQVGLACCHLAMAAYSRHKDLEFAASMSDLSLLVFESYAEPSSRGTGFILQSFMVEHLRVPLRTILPFIETSVEYAFNSNDPYLMLTSFGLMAATRLYLGQDMSEIETFCTETPDEILDWTRDVRAGVLLIAVKQVTRALQGKTSWRNPDLIMTDDQHSTIEYMEHVCRHSMRADRPYNIYWSYAMIPLYAYGHYDKIIELGTGMMESIERLWCMRVSHLTHFILPLAILTKHIDNSNTGGLEEYMRLVLKCKEIIDLSRKACDVNYAMWALLIEALMHEHEKKFNSAVQAYEAAIDHCEVHGFPLEEAMALELYGDFLVRKGSKRPARAIIKEAIAAWTGLGAVGKAEHLSEKHEWLLKTATAPRHNDASTQTVDSLANINHDTAVATPAVQTNLEDDRKKHWLENSGSHVETGPLDIPSVGLDIIDLSSILEFSQVMSSELQIDKLLTKMIEIILESCSGSDTAIITTEFEDTGFAIAAIGSQDDGQKAFLDGLPFSEMEDKMAQQITHYTLRTRQEVLVHNVLEDERFSIVSEGYNARYPAGRSVITLPIIQANNLLGVIHIEGKPNSFTQRNVVVLRLLCNQVGISLSNAFLFRRVRKVSATNAAMVESQKRALAQAREAEQKAKIAEAEANHNVKLKEDAARAKSVFLANVSHDLRTPMNGVIGLSELLKGTKLDKEQDNYVESIRVCADTLLTLINDILDFSKLEAGKMKISTVPLSLKETIREVVRALRYTHRDRGLETIEDLDKVPEDLVVMGDPVRLHQIFMNLLSNSYKFTPKGYVKVSAMVVREGKGRVRLECSVADTGIGIPEEHKSRLFRPFSQADNSTARSYGGSGLGLSICKAIIEDVLGGLIWLDSTPGVGTTVTFQLVFQRAPKDSAVTAPWMQNFNQADKHDVPRVTQVVGRDLTMVPREKIRVCIAEDNPINQKIAVKFVRGLGLECEAFSDGQQAVDALRQRSKEGRPFHVVLMDVQMPVLDGYDATREIRKETDPNVNQALVIAMTASAIEGDREKCLEAGMNDYLAKPVRSSVLSEMLDQYLAPARPTKLRRRPVTRQSGEDSRSDGSGTPGSQTSSSSASQTIALTPDDERLQQSTSPVVSPPALPSPAVSLPAISPPTDSSPATRTDQIPERLKRSEQQSSSTQPNNKF